MKTLLIFLLSLATFFTTTSCEESDFMTQAVEASEIAPPEIVDSAIDLEKTALNNFTYTQTKFVGTIYLGDDAYNEVPETIWNRATTPVVYGVAVKTTANSQYLTFWDSAQKRKKLNSSNALFAINVTNGGATQLYSSGQFVADLSENMAIHNKPLFKIIQFNIVSSPQ